MAGASPVVLVGVQGLVAGLVAADPLHEVVHGLSRAAVSVVGAGELHFLQPEQT